MIFRRRNFALVIGYKIKSAVANIGDFSVYPPLTLGLLTLSLNWVLWPQNSLLGTF